MVKKLISLGVFLFLVSFASAQEVGTVSGSFESNTHYYYNDKQINAKQSEEKLASNNYLEFKYQYKNFTAGFRYEAYLPALKGFSPVYNKSDIANKYITFQNDNLLITAGNFYDQFGSGLVFRSFEERQLGIDNSLEGVNVKYNFNNKFILKGIIGKQRDGFNLGKGQVRGLDFNLSLNNLLNIHSIPRISFGASIVSKYEEYTGADDSVSPLVDAYSSRLDVEGENASLSLEYVEKDEDYNETMALPTPKGKALLVNGTAFLSGLSFNYTIRRIENMAFYSERKATPPQLSINYIPVLVKQHTYSLSNVYVYGAQGEGEIGGQFDLFYKFKKKSFLGGKYGTQIALNYSQYNGLKKKGKDDTEFFAMGDDMYYRDLSLEITKKWSKKFKTIFVYNYQKYNKGKVEKLGKLVVNPSIVVLDMQYKFTPKNSMRMELQHLSINNDMKNWMASLVELSFAPSWSVFVGDDYNYGSDDKVHYYTCGGSFSKKSTKIIMTYGRQREGLSCVGGVCRMMPAMKALTLSLSTRF